MNRGDVKLIVDRCVAHDVPDAADLIERQAAQIEMMREFIARAPVSSGVCCCGEAIDGHSSPMSCGHSPVDLWDHSVEQILSAIADLSGVIMCEKKPVAYMAVYKDQVMGFIPTQESGTIPVYRAITELPK